MLRQKSFARIAIAIAVAIITIVGATIAPGLARRSPGITLTASPETVVWGIFDATIPPVLRIKSGQIVTIDTVSAAGLQPNDDPVEFFGRYGIPPEQVLPELVDIQRREQTRLGPHILTGPIYIEEAEPGDLLEVRVLDVKVRTPYGVNLSGPGLGVLPDLLSERVVKVIPFNDSQTEALFSEEITIPLAPFMGVMGVAPPPEDGRLSSVAPAAWGGNIDDKEMTANSTLYLPVFNQGALFSTGDGHAAQGDGEVNITAIETALTPTFQFIVHKGKGANVRGPRAETPTDYVAMGLDPDLDEALQISVMETIDFLQQEKGLSVADAYSLASLAVDFEVAEAVDQTEIIHGLIPKSIFATNPEYWAEDPKFRDRSRDKKPKVERKVW